MFTSLRFHCIYILIFGVLPWRKAYAALKQQVFQSTREVKPKTALVVLSENGNGNYRVNMAVTCEIEFVRLYYIICLCFQSRKAHGVELQGNVVIFDEAHNLVSW